MGRIKEISRKSVHTRKRNPVVYLICEGSETEIRYFKRFRSRGCNIDIIPISSQYKSADRLVQKAKATMGNNPYYPEDGDSIWCVFDRDDNSNEVLLRAKQSAQKEGYHLAYSNPSFELWFLLHFVNQQAEVEDCQALIPLLKQTNRIPDYEKNKDYFDVLKPLQATAIQRAKARACQIQCQGIEPISRQSNRNRQISRRIKKHLWLSNRSWARDVHSFGILHSWGALAGKSCSAQASSIWLIAGAFRRTQSK